MTEKWDPSIPEHKELAHAIEFGNGIPEMRRISKAREALKSVGFIIEHEEDLAERPDPVPWYYPLEGDIRKAQTAWDYFTVWRMSWSGKLVTHNVLRLMELFGFVPKGTYDVGESLKVAGDALTKGGQTKVCVFFELLCINLTFPSSVVHAHVPRHQQETFRRVRRYIRVRRRGADLRMRVVRFTCLYHNYRIFYLDIFVYSRKSMEVHCSDYKIAWPPASGDSAT